MKTNSGEKRSLSLPPSLLAQIQAAAAEEHRPAKEVLQDAVERYLRECHPAVVDTRNGFAAAAQLRELRKGTLLSEGVTVRDLINAGRA